MMKTGNTVSVAMAVCNGKRYLAQQLQSILHQSLVPDEIVICDDASQDSTVEIANAFQRKYPDIINLIRNENRLGASKNFELAIRLSTGTVICLADQDDVWKPEKIQILSTLILNAKQPAGAFANSTITDENLKPTGENHWQIRGFSPALLDFLYGDHLDKLSIFLKRVPAAGHDMAFHSSLKPLLLPFPNLPECHDTWIGLVLALINVWNFTGEELTMFRQHDGNASRSGRNKSLLQQWHEARKSITDNSFAWHTALYRELLARLNSRLAPEVIELVRDRLDHSQRRAAMNTNFARRLPMVLHELQTKRYFYYARGWKSVFQDLFLR